MTIQAIIFIVVAFLIARPLGLISRGVITIGKKIIVFPWA